MITLLTTGPPYGCYAQCQCLHMRLHTLLPSPRSPASKVGQLVHTHVHSRQPPSCRNEIGICRCCPSHPVCIYGMDAYGINLSVVPPPRRKLHLNTRHIQLENNIITLATNYHAALMNCPSQTPDNKVLGVVHYTCISIRTWSEC